MKLKVELDGEAFLLDLQAENQGVAEYALTGAVSLSGKASVVATSPGVFSVLLGPKSFSVAVTRRGADLELWAAGRRHVIALSDPRDRADNAERLSASGPVEIRAQMPGKVIKLLVEEGGIVEAGQGVIIVEAMKMQNEMKSPKSGEVRELRAVEGGTVAAGETLMVIE